MLTVVKVGGGLLCEAGEEALRSLCATIADAGTRHPLLVVPGGSAFADAVRDLDRRVGVRPETAHWMAILGMDQFGWALADLIPGAVRQTGLEPVPAGVVGVLLPHTLLAARDPLPHSWEVTADSIAAWVAGVAGAERLVLVKPVAGLHRTWPAKGDPVANLTCDDLEALAPGGVDAYLPTALRAARVETWVIDGRAPGRLTDLLETGATTGTRIAAAA